MFADVGNFLTYFYLDFAMTEWRAIKAIGMALEYEKNGEDKGEVIEVAKAKKRDAEA